MEDVVCSPKATKKKIVTGVRMIAESRAKSWSRTLEEEERDLEIRAKDFNNFIRDHRSQDDLYLEVEREYSEICSLCERDWEVMDIDGVKCCANCGKPIDNV